MGRSIVPDDYSHVADLSQTALQYGPFFFAVVFVLFVPGIGHRWFSDLLAKTDKDSPEYRSAVEVCRFYWESGIKTGLALVAISIAWWFWVQYTIASPTAKRHIVEQHTRRINITRLTNDDHLNISPGHTDDYDVYVNQPTLDIPATVVAIFHRPPKPHQAIEVDWVNDKQFADGPGAASTPLNLCVGTASERTVAMRKSSNGGQLEGSC